MSYLFVSLQKNKIKRFIKQLSYETQNLLAKFYKYSKKHETRQKTQCILLSNKWLTRTFLLINIY